MNVCNNCNANLTCSCQKRKASNGQGCCTKCIGSYEGSLKKITTEPVVIPSPEAPTNLTAVYKGPGQQLD